MFVFEAFFKPLEKLSHTVAFTMSFPAASIYIAYKTRQTSPTPHPDHFPFSILHLTASISILSHKSKAHAELSRQKSWSESKSKQIRKLLFRTWHARTMEIYITTPPPAQLGERNGAWYFVLKKIWLIFYDSECLMKSSNCHRHLFSKGPHCWDFSPQLINLST